jgi:hypothetical protein
MGSALKLIYRNVEEAALYYERDVNEVEITGSRNSFRVRRSQNKAEFSRSQFAELRNLSLDVLDRCISAPPFITQTFLSDYLVKARVQPNGTESKHGPIIGTGGSSFVTLEHRDSGVKNSPSNTCL